MPISAARDANRVPVALLTLNTDGVTVKAMKVSPSTFQVQVSDGTTGSGTTPTNAQRDANRSTAIWGVSSVNGTTPVEIWCDSSGNLLINSN